MGAGRRVGCRPEPRVVVDPAVVDRYRRFSRFNSPYPAHDFGRAVDLYPASNAGLSPVAGEVLGTRTVRCPPREYAAAADHLILVAVDDGARLNSPVDTASQPTLVARILHVDPVVSAGDRVEIGEPLGPMVRSGFFGRWVDNHVHLDFRTADQNLYRAGGSLPLSVDVAVASLRWDGTGTVVETGPTHVRLDSPTHPTPGGEFAAIATDCGAPLDGGFAHYGGGVFGPTRQRGTEASTTTLSFLGEQIGTATVGATATTVEWDPIDLRVDGERITGLSLFAAREDAGAKLVALDHGFAVGDEVTLTVAPSADPIRLGGRRPD